MKQDDTSWLAGLFAEHSRAVRAFAFRRVPADAVDDIVAEVFAVTWQNRSRVPEHALPWLYRTAANLIGHHHRASSRRRTYESRGADASEVRDEADAVADRVTLARALDQLAEADTEVLRLAYWEDLAIADVAVVVGCSPGAARVRLHRARQRLQAVLGDGEAPASVLSLTGEEPR